jgi:hypothetical protein
MTRKAPFRSVISTDASTLRQELDGGFGLVRDFQRDEEQASEAVRPDRCVRPAREGTAGVVTPLHRGRQS